ncbi:MAG: hypothetical protein KDL87_01060, partial [Verrucomicrobiae bacterium]|nr:hypothetical protein [Verrucomicrobiae bacterium]
TLWRMTRIFPILALWGLAVSLTRAGETFTLDLPPKPGERFLEAEFSCWIPDSETPLRAVIVHQHGCTNASPEKHPPVTGDFHWQALARKHGCALLSPQYRVESLCSDWNDPDSGSERALFDALAHIGKEADRPELAEIPWLLWGHSGGSSWSSQMIVRHPGRVLAASFRGGCHRQFGDPAFREVFASVALDLPLLFVWGKRETVPESSHYVSWNPMNTMYRELRSRGGKVTRLIDPTSEHGCDNSRLVTIPFFDAVLAGETPGLYLDRETFAARETDPETRTLPEAVWLPNSDVAALWQTFSRSGTLPPVAAPKTAPEVDAKRDETGRLILAWEVTPEIVGGLRAYRVYRDGRLWKEIGLAPDEAVATGRDATPEALRKPTITDTPQDGPHTYTVTFLDAAGNESPPSREIGGTEGTRASPALRESTKKEASAPFPWACEEIARFPAKEAFQGVAVDETSFYAIGSKEIGKYRKDSGARVAGWENESGGPVRHLNSGIVTGGELYLAHSNFPKMPEESSMEVFDARTLKPLRRKTIENPPGSLTWIVPYRGGWLACFAHYLRTGDSADSRVVQFDSDWKMIASLPFPSALVEKFGDHSSSGGAIGPEGKLFISGHDARELYVLSIPETPGGKLAWEATVAIPTAGQAFAWDSAGPGLLYSIERKTREVVVSRVRRSGE